jgi:ion channel
MPMAWGAAPDTLRHERRRGLAGVADAYRRHRFAWLFASLLATLGAGATLSALVPRYHPMQVMLAINLLAAVASVAHEYAMRVPLAIALAYVVARTLLATLGVPGMLGLSEALWVTAIVLATVTSVRHALRAGTVDAERIFAALDAYLLAGLLFGVAYWMLEHAWPPSLAGTSRDLPHAIYFSFVTIATLGYGDVVPVSAPARGLAVVEAVSGQMYLAVLVARLVTLYSQQREH